MALPPDDQSVAAAEAGFVRFWWLKRITLGLGVFLLLMAITWVMWDQYSRALLRQRIAAYRQAGEPTTPEDLQPPAVADERNAALVYNRAIAAMAPNVDCPTSSAVDFDNELPYHPDWFTMERRAAKANAKTFELARQASKLEEADWGLKMRSPLIAQLLPHLATQRTLANHLGDHALLEHFEGNDAQALEDIRVMLHHGNAVGQTPFVVSSLLQIGIKAVAMDRLATIAADLQVGPPETQRATQEQVHALIRELLADNSAASGMAKAMLTERISTAESTPAEASMALKPSFRLDACRAMDAVTAASKALRLPDLPSARKEFLPVSKGVWNYESNPAWMLRNTLTPLITDRAVTKAYQVICEERMAAIRLAFRLYVIDAGHYPATLDALESKYLPALPHDPFAADHRSFGYIIVADGKRPILYSVGANGVDETRSMSPNIDSRRLAGWRGSSGGEPDDQYRDLSAWVNPEPRRPMSRPPTPQELGLNAVPDNANKADAPGDQPQGKQKAQ